MSEQENLSPEDKAELEDINRTMDYLTDHIQEREFNIYQALELKFELNRLMTTCVYQKCKTEIDALKS